MVISLVAERTVPSGAAGLPPVAVADAVSVTVKSLAGRALTTTLPGLFASSAAYPLSVRLQVYVPMVAFEGEPEKLLPSLSK